MFPVEVLDAAVRRGSLDEIKWLHRRTAIAHYDCHTAFQCAGQTRHLEILVWLLTSCESEESDFKVVRRRDESPFGVICWREKRYLYAATPDEGILPSVTIVDNSESGLDQVSPSPPLCELYPLMDWAAQRGDLAFVEKLHNDPVGTTMCTYRAMLNAAGAGHLEMVRWLHKNRPEHLDIAEALAIATKGEHMEILDWLRSKFGLEMFILSAYKQAWASQKFKALQWMIDHFRDALSRLEPLPLHQVSKASLDLIKTVCELHHLVADLKSACSAVRCGHLDVVRWMVEHNNPGIVLNQKSRTTLLQPAVRGDEMELVRWCVEELDAWWDNASVAAVKRGSTPLVKYLCAKATERASLRGARSGQQNQALQKHVLLGAVNSGNLELVKWCIEDLGVWGVRVVITSVWSRQSAIFKYLLTKDEERVTPDATMLLKEQGIEYDSTLWMLSDPEVDEGMIDWILMNCPDPEIRLSENRKLQRAMAYSVEIASISTFNESSDVGIPCMGRQRRLSCKSPSSRSYQTPETIHESDSERHTQIFSR